MSAREVHLELLIGCKVRDPDGESAGRIEEVEVEERDGKWLVTGYLTGPVGMLARLSSLDLGVWLLGHLGAAKSPGGYHIPWDQLDLADPGNPRVRCPVRELDELE
ncbi:MAG TPA: hypothetical protein VFL93_04010 [Longimicrobiaceae bacterium]|nr:hypothetical protein [Longimicrobiaceae bacterium]